MREETAATLRQLSTLCCSPPPPAGAGAGAGDAGGGVGPVRGALRGPGQLLGYEGHRVEA